jgi:hypothetical protein
MYVQYTAIIIYKVCILIALLALPPGSQWRVVKERKWFCCFGSRMTVVSTADIQA